MVANSWEAWWHTASLRTARARGPVTLLWSLLSRINWSWQTPWTLRTHDNVDIHIFNIDTDEFAHRLRDASRIWCWQQAFLLHKHFDGVQHTGIDRVATLFLCQKGFLDPHSLRLLRSILVDAVWTSSRLHQAGRLSSSACSCGHHHQNTEHFFWTCSELVDLQTKHHRLFALRSACDPWPPCLELCGLVPASFVAPQHTNTQVAVLVQNYLLDVVRRSWEIGWPTDDVSAPATGPSQPSVESLDLCLPDALPKLSPTTFPWPVEFCRDLLDYLRTLVWSKTPTRAGVTWAELAVNFEIHTQKALPRNSRKRGPQSRAYGEPTVPLLSAPNNLYQKTMTMSNACRSLARVLGKPVVVGRQSRQPIPGLAGKLRFQGLDRRPTMLHDEETATMLQSSLHERLTSEIAAVSADITSGELKSGNPVDIASRSLRLLKWPVSDVSVDPSPVPLAASQVATPVATVSLETPVTKTVSPPNVVPPSSNNAVEFGNHDAYKCGNLWKCRKCPATAGHSNIARFRKVRCFGDKSHLFESDGSQQFRCKGCGATCSTMKSVNGKMASPCPGPSKQEKDARNENTKTSEKDTGDFMKHDVYKSGQNWACRRCPATCGPSNSGRFKTVQCFGDKSHHYESDGPKQFRCKHCGDTCSSMQAARGKMSYPCPGPTMREKDFVHVIPSKPDSQGKFVCSKCKRCTVKKSVARFMKTLCFGSHATTRSDAIRATRFACGLSTKGLPSELAPRLEAFKQSDVNMVPD